MPECPVRPEARPDARIAGADFRRRSSPSLAHQVKIQFRVPPPAKQADAYNRPPANIFNQTVARIGVGSDHHFAAREFAVVEGKKQAATPVGFRGAISAEWKRAAVQAREARQYA